MRDDKSKICLGFILYNPDSSFFDRISCVSGKNKIYLFDNSPNTSINQNLISLDNISYQSHNKNLGLGHGLVSICSKAYNDGMEGLVFFDQDTIFDTDTIDYIKDFKEKNSYLKEKYSSITFNNKGRKPCSQDTVLAINSGTLFFLESLRKIGWHNPSYFVDCVDYEYCFKARQNNFMLMEHSCTPGFDHLKLQDADLISVFGRKFSLLRCYSRERIIGTVQGASRLILTSIRSKDILFTYLSVKFIVIYLTFQIIAYLLRPFVKGN
jgi:rhamnosyltransferase